MSIPREDTTARLVIACPDQRGIVATVTGFLYHHGVNILSLHEFATEPEGGTFFMRLEFETPHLDIGREALELSFAEVCARRYGMDWRFAYGGERKRVAILVSKEDHALLELLWRRHRGELPCDVTAVVSNHPDVEGAVASFGVPFHHVPVPKDGKEAAEARILEVLDAGGRGTDLVVLARYMQVLTPAFVARLPNRIINIHHSFLPAFVGANPHRRAFDRGVKRIGATAHYVTDDLDEGPIIEQDVIRVTHRHSVRDLVALGRDIERQVLFRAVRWHLEDRVLVYGRRTVVFE